MGWNQVIAPREQGGLGIPDIRSRVEAIEVMWVKKWMSPEKNKPRWTNILDEIIKKKVAKAPMVDKESRISWIKQSWQESEASDSKMSNGIRNMLKIARKHNITLEPLKYSKEIKNQELLWHNRLMNEANYHWNKKSARCIRTNHKVKTINDLYEQGSETECENKKACSNMTRMLKSMVPDIINPTLETPHKVRTKKLDLTPKRIKENKNNRQKKVFNPDITARENVLDQVRLFNNERSTKIRRQRITPRKPAYRKITNGEELKTKAKIVTVTQDYGTAKQTTKVNISLKGGTKDKISFKLEKQDQSKDKAMATAILWILKRDKKNKLKIVTTEKRLLKWIGGGINEAEDKNWVNIRNTVLWKSVLNRLRERNNKVEIKILNEKEVKK